MNNEISQASEIKKPEVESFKNIKPESGMTVSDAKEFWKKKLNTVNNEVIEQKQYLDDNEDVYRIGNDLLPNTEYIKNDYKYKTDEEGRIVSAEGKLQIKDHKGRKEMESREVLDKNNYREKDQKGHLIADRFNGTGGLENLVPMDAKLNQGDYSKLENMLAKAVDGGADVRFKVEPKYEGNSGRPTEFKVSYSIDGEKTVKVFRNESEASK